jgi:hypothetical protein
VHVVVSRTIQFSEWHQGTDTLEGRVWIATTNWISYPKTTRTKAVTLMPRFWLIMLKKIYYRVMCEPVVCAIVAHITAVFTKLSWSVGKLPPFVILRLASRIAGTRCLPRVLQLLSVRSEFRLAVGMTMFWVVTPCRLVGRYHCFGETCRLYAKDGDSMFFRNVCFWVYTAS